MNQLDTLALSEAFLKIYAASSLELFSDHSLVIFAINSKTTTKGKPYTLCNAKTKWPYFQELLKTTLNNSVSLKTDDDITRAVESFNNVAQ
jgi:hypothetical protein